MRGRTWLWVGAAITVAAIAGLAVYFGVIGLESADKAASVVAGLAAVAGLAVAVYGVTRSGGGTSGPGRRVSQRARASTGGQINQVGGHQGFGLGDSSASGSDQVRQDAKAANDAKINQVGGDQRLGPGADG